MASSRAERRRGARRAGSPPERGHPPKPSLLGLRAVHKPSAGRRWHGEAVRSSRRRRSATGRRPVAEGTVAERSGTAREGVSRGDRPGRAIVSRAARGAGARGGRPRPGQRGRGAAADGDRRRGGGATPRRPTGEPEEARSARSCGTGPGPDGSVEGTATKKARARARAFRRRRFERYAARRTSGGSRSAISARARSTAPYPTSGGRRWSSSSEPMFASARAAGNASTRLHWP